MKAESNAELGVCEMAPKDLDCIQARQEEVETIEVLHAQLHKQVRNVMTVSGGLVGNVSLPALVLYVGCRWECTTCPLVCVRSIASQPQRDTVGDTTAMSACLSLPWQQD